MQFVERISDALLIDPREGPDRPADAHESPSEAVQPRRVRKDLRDVALQGLDLTPCRRRVREEPLGHPHGAERPADPLTQAPVVDLGDLQAAAADVEHPAVAQRGRVDRPEIPGAGLRALVDDPDGQSRVGQARERLVPVAGVADRAGGDGDHLVGARPADGGREETRGPLGPLEGGLGQDPVAFAGRDAHGLANLVHEPERPAVAVLEHDQPEGVRSAVHHRQTM